MNDDDLGYDCPDQNQTHGYERCIACRRWVPAAELHDGLDCEACYARGAEDAVNADLPTEAA